MAELLCALLSVSVLYLVPSVVERGLEIHVPEAEVALAGVLYAGVLSFAHTLMLAFSDEFRWRGCLLLRVFAHHCAKWRCSSVAASH